MIFILQSYAQVMTARIMERGRSSGRIDDNEEAIRKRLVTYHESTMPIIKEFEARGKLREINSDQTIGACAFCEGDQRERARALVAAGLQSCLRSDVAIHGGGRDRDRE